jgi:hypothetical protein
LTCWFGLSLELLGRPNGERIGSIPCAATDWSVDAADHQPQRSLWEAVVPAAILGLPAELARVDHLLDDPGFWQPFRAHFDPVVGRPSIPIETYLRMMFLKFRYRLGYELLCREVADSISWQRFCRIPLGEEAGLRRSRSCTMLPECVVGGGIAQSTGAAGVGRVLADVPGGLLLVMTGWSVTGHAGRRQMRR